MEHRIKLGVIDYARPGRCLILVALLAIQLLILLSSTAKGRPRRELHTLPPEARMSTGAILFTKETQEPIPSLEMGSPIVRSLGGGDAHPYQLTIAAGRYARVTVEQRRINVAVSAFDAEGKRSPM